MLRHQADWRHYLAAGILLGLVCWGLWQIMRRSETPLPNVPAPAGSRPMPASPDSP